MHKISASISSLRGGQGAADRDKENKKKDRRNSASSFPFPLSPVDEFGAYGGGGTMNTSKGKGRPYSSVSSSNMMAQGLPPIPQEPPRPHNHTFPGHAQHHGHQSNIPPSLSQSQQNVIDSGSGSTGRSGVAEHHHSPHAPHVHPQASLQQQQQAQQQQVRSPTAALHNMPMVGQLLNARKVYKAGYLWRLDGHSSSSTSSGQHHHHHHSRTPSSSANAITPTTATTSFSSSTTASNNADPKFVKYYMRLEDCILCLWPDEGLKKAQANGTSIHPTSMNIQDGFITLASVKQDWIKRLEQFDSPTPFAFVLNTAGNNSTTFVTESEIELRRWINSIRLAIWERQRLENLYTAARLGIKEEQQLRPIRSAISFNNNGAKLGRSEGLLDIRLPGDTEWKRVYAVLTEPGNYTASLARKNSRNKNGGLPNSASSSSLTAPTTGKKEKRRSILSNFLGGGHSNTNSSGHGSSNYHTNGSNSSSNDRDSSPVTSAYNLQLEDPSVGPTLALFGILNSPNNNAGLNPGSTPSTPRNNNSDHRASLSHSHSHSQLSSSSSSPSISISSLPSGALKLTRRPLCVVNAVWAAYAVWPESEALIPHARTFKIHGRMTWLEQEVMSYSSNNSLSASGNSSASRNPITPFEDAMKRENRDLGKADNQVQLLCMLVGNESDANAGGPGHAVEANHKGDIAGGLLSWLLGIYDAFRLHGRPDKMLYDPRNPQSPYFAQPAGPSRGALYFDPALIEDLPSYKESHPRIIHDSFMRLLVDRMSRVLGNGLPPPHHMQGQGQGQQLHNTSSSSSNPNSRSGSPASDRQSRAQSHSQQPPNSNRNSVVAVGSNAPVLPPIVGGDSTQNYSNSGRSTPNSINTKEQQRRNVSGITAGQMQKTRSRPSYDNSNNNGEEHLSAPIAGAGSRSRNVSPALSQNSFQQHQAYSSSSRPDSPSASFGHSEGGTSYGRALSPPDSHAAAYENGGQDGRTPYLTPLVGQSTGAKSTRSDRSGVSHRDLDTTLDMYAQQEHIQRQQQQQATKPDSGHSHPGILRPGSAESSRRLHRPSLEDIHGRRAAGGGGVSAMQNHNDQVNSSPPGAPYMSDRAIVKSRDDDNRYGVGAIGMLASPEEERLRSADTDSPQSDGGKYYNKHQARSITSSHGSERATSSLSVGMNAPIPGQYVYTPDLSKSEAAAAPPSLAASASRAISPPKSQQALGTSSNSNLRTKEEHLENDTTHPLSITTGGGRSRSGSSGGDDDVHNAASSLVAGASNTAAIGSAAVSRDYGLPPSLSPSLSQDTKADHTAEMAVSHRQHDNGHINDNDENDSNAFYDEPAALYALSLADQNQHDESGRPAPAGGATNLHPTLSKMIRQRAGNRIGDATPDRTDSWASDTSRTVSAGPQSRQDTLATVTPVSAAPTSASEYSQIGTLAESLARSNGPSRAASQRLPPSNLSQQLPIQSNNMSDSSATNIPGSQPPLDKKNDLPHTRHEHEPLDLRQSKASNATSLSTAPSEGQDDYLAALNYVALTENNDSQVIKPVTSRSPPLNGRPSISIRTDSVKQHTGATINNTPRNNLKSSNATNHTGETPMSPTYDEPLSPDPYGSYGDTSMSKAPKMRVVNASPEKRSRQAPSSDNQTRKPSVTSQSSSRKPGRRGVPGGRKTAKKLGTWSSDDDDDDNHDDKDDEDKDSEDEEEEAQRKKVIEEHRQAAEQVAIAEAQKVQQDRERQREEMPSHLRESTSSTSGSLRRSLPGLPGPSTDPYLNQNASPTVGVYAGQFEGRPYPHELLHHQQQQQQQYAQYGDPNRASMYSWQSQLPISGGSTISPAWQGQQNQQRLSGDSSSPYGRNAHSPYGHSPSPSTHEPGHFAANQNTMLAHMPDNPETAAADGKAQRAAAVAQHGLLQTGIEQKHQKSAAQLEALAKETGGPLLQLEHRAQAPQGGLVGAIASHERDRKREGGLGATLTERDRERRAAEMRQREMDNMGQRQGYGGPGFGMPGMPTMPNFGGMPNPGFGGFGNADPQQMQQQIAMLAAQNAYLQAMASFNQSGMMGGQQGYASPPFTPSMGYPVMQGQHMPYAGSFMGMPQAQSQSPQPMQGQYGGSPAGSPYDQAQHGRAGSRTNNEYFRQ